MRLGVVVHAGTGEQPLDALVRQAATAEEVGLDLLWIPSTAPDGPPLMTAAALAARTRTVRLAACVRVGAHPLEVAEAATVVDNLSNGRLVLVLDGTGAEDGVLAETVEVVLAALAARPFRHQGARWTIPAGLPENDGREERIVLAPPPAQVELPVWLAGPSSLDVARQRGLTVVAGGDPAAVWGDLEASLGPAAARLRRPQVRAVGAVPDAGIDADALVASLRADQRAWGLDVAVLTLPDELDQDARERSIRSIATFVAPRVVQHELPPGLEEHWRAALASEPAARA